VTQKVKAFADADETIKIAVREESADDCVDLLVAILRSELLSPELSPAQIEKTFNAYVAWNNAVENVSQGCLLPSESH
jgi:Domain of unknown function in PX-proteins (DUF3818)